MEGMADMGKEPGPEVPAINRIAGLQNRSRKQY